MPFRRSSRGSSGSSTRPRRPMDWSGFSYHSDITKGPGTPVSSTCGWVISPDEIARNYTDPTIMAMRVALAFSVLNDGTIATRAGVDTDETNPSTVAFGIIDFAATPLNEPIEDRRTNAPVPNPCPNPVDHPHLDWMYTFYFPLVRGIAQPTVLTNLGSGDSVIESRARRRMGNTKGLLWVATHAVAHSGDLTISYSFNCRYLLKE